MTEILRAVGSLSGIALILILSAQIKKYLKKRK